MDPAALGMAARVASALIKPLVAKLFVREESGAAVDAARLSRDSNFRHPSTPSGRRPRRG
ncbi:hypothetical protein [Streptomyces aureoverticillatus]|uniref:hypothetical protein n=1 Tax=Streptomyces aureoverticillatus TaxID=66871 RepID=UPI0013DA5B99|nr:hypothetical protein [Streptomyces aureoverticillatus]QIB47834.1 hypothetical protein G3H79_36955 [Streptomyces aureoverticillatus]